MCNGKTTPGRFSGLRLGSAGLTARGMGKPEIIRIADLMDTVIGRNAGADTIARVAAAVEELCQRFPVYVPFTPKISTGPGL